MPRVSPRRQSATTKDVLEEIVRRRGALGFNSDRLAKLCFPAQLSYVTGLSRRQVVRCSRRAGKTWGIAAKMLYHAVADPVAHQAYVAPTLKQARRIFWPVLKRINAEHRVGGKANEAECFLEFKNGSRIYIAGAKDQGEADSLRGLALKNAIIDEAQSARPSILQGLLDDIIEPALVDYSGGLDVVGTPGAVPSGYFHSIDVGDEAVGWDHHRWNLSDNIELPARKAGKSVGDLLREVREHHGWTEANATYRREWLGEWVADSGALMLHYDPRRNACDYAAAEDDWSYVVAFDIGYEDADAIAVLGWQRHSRVVHLVFERVAPKQTITTLGDQLAAVIARYRPIRVVGDLGGLGKKIASELQTRWQLPIEAADKHRKAEHVALLDDALVVGRMKAPAKSRFADDCALLQWDAAARAKGQMKEAEGFHSDVCFVAGTMVATARGEVPIESVRVGDLAWTCAGLRRVTHSALTGPSELVVAARFADGLTLTATPDHRVWTQRGWARIDSLASGDQYVTLRSCDTVLSPVAAARSIARACVTAITSRLASDAQPLRSAHVEFMASPRRWSGAAACGEDIQALRVQTTGTTSAVAVAISTVRCGLTFTARFLLDATSTIVTATSPTTSSRIWSAYAQGITQAITPRAGNPVRSPMPHDSRRPPGMPPTRAERGTDNTPSEALHARMRLAGATSKSPRRSWRARFAELLSPHAPANAGFAVQRVTPAGRQPVYAISVEGEHEFFANGVLVKNCDAVLYGFRVCTAHFEAPAPVKPPEGDRLMELALAEKPSREWWDDGMPSLDDPFE